MGRDERARCSAPLTEATVVPRSSATSLPVEDLAEDEHGSLARREMLERGDEGKPDRVLDDRCLSWIAVGGDDACVRDRQDPGCLRARLPQGRARGASRAEVHGTRATLRAVQHVQTDVDGDTVEPREQRGPPLEAIEAAPGAEGCLLYGILGFESRPQHPVAVRGELAVLLELRLKIGA